MEEINFADIDEIKVGHKENLDAATGCTVILCENGATGGVDVRGGAPGTRETDLLDPLNMVEEIHGVLLTGGSAFGLDAASGVMKYLEEKKVGLDVGVTSVPIVVAAVLFDLDIGDHRIRPDKSMGYQACHNASKGKVQEGTIGAGTGATVGKILGGQYSMKGGLGSYAVKLGDLKVGALVAVNAMGDILDTNRQKIIAGALKDDYRSFANTEKVMMAYYDREHKPFVKNTSIGVIASNAKLSKAQANKVASMAHNGFARTIRPSHTMSDGDTIFTMASNKVQAHVNVVGLLAANVMERAVINGIKKASSLAGIKAYKDLFKVT